MQEVFAEGGPYFVALSILVMVIKNLLKERRERREGSDKEEVVLLRRIADSVEASGRRQELIERRTYEMAIEQRSQSERLAELRSDQNRVYNEILDLRRDVSTPIGRDTAS